MPDLMMENYAKLLVDYSMRIVKNDYVLIEGADLALPLIKEICRYSLRKGAYVDVQTNLPGIREIFFEEASDDQLEYINPRAKWAYSNYDVIIAIHGNHNIKALANVESRKFQLNRKANSEISKILRKRLSDKSLRWCVIPYPTHSNAQECNMSLEEYQRFVFKSLLLDTDNPVEEWYNLSESQEKICEFLNSAKVMHIKSKDTDLKLDIEGRIWLNSDGKVNLPDGEICTSPIEDSVEGYIRCSYPGIFKGQEIEDIRLEFKKGKVVQAKASKGEKLLLELLDFDEGSNRLGEVAIGTNHGISKFTKNMLFDEKIGGTIHIALGNSLVGTNGQNNSSIHLDLLCDMNNDSEIYFDEELVYKNGKFILK